MSARCWWRRRNKYLRPYLNYINRHPDRVLVFPGGAVLGGEGVVAVDYIPAGVYKRAHIFLVRDVPVGALVDN